MLRHDPPQSARDTEGVRVMESVARMVGTRLELETESDEESDSEHEVAQGREIAVEESRRRGE